MEKLYIVVVNGEDQYSIWPASKSLPLGWFEVEPGIAHAKETCLELIASRWKDMRPLSFRRIIQKETASESTLKIGGTHAS